MTALMTVCLNGHLPTVVLLLKNGADHSRQNKVSNNSTPKRVACDDRFCHRGSRFDVLALCCSAC